MSLRSRRGGDAPPGSNTSTGRNSGAASYYRTDSRRDRSAANEAAQARRPTRGPKKRYVESDYSDDDDGEGSEDEVDEEEEEKDGVHAEDSDVDMDAEGEADDMDVDADELGEEDADGEDDIDVMPAHKASKPAAADLRAAAAFTAKGSTKKRTLLGAAGRKRGLNDADEEEDEEDEEDDEDEDEEDDGGDDELSEAESVAEGETNLDVAGDEDAEGEDDDEANIEGETEMIAGGDEEDEDDEDDGGQDAEDDMDEGSRAGTPDLTKMTRRQRARFEETPQEYMKLSDEVQAKKVFTAEELSMRRQEMARRRRNLSDKRNEEVKAETINKLLKRQAPKTTKKNAQAEDEEDAVDGSGRSAAVFLRWTNNKQGTRLGVTNEILVAPVGSLFGPPSTGKRMASHKMVEEIA
ncbi:hypothetical protein SEPCBS119000_001774 [Sporothrix epigloea]|uniref:INO80 complex subunit B-like conserved region domain-containing protein n=1 Tax=Sporothrix epigloea TaxID=1892477 RepID=A0ABP0DCJ3_9PEZI